MKELFANYWWQLLLVAVVAYAFGGVNYAILFSKVIKHKDIREMGSGNAGTTNVFRVFGLRMGALTFLCDVLKGVVPALACMFIFRFTDRETDFMYWSGLFAVLGHIFPVFHQLRGGKGVATAIGVCLVVQPILTLCCVPPAIALIFAVDRMSVMSILFSIFLTVWHWTMLLDDVGLASCVFVTCMFVAVLFAHRHNIVRILTGKEMRTGVRRKILRKDKREARLERERLEKEKGDTAVADDEAEIEKPVETENKTGDTDGENDSDANAERVSASAEGAIVSNAIADGNVDAEQPQNTNADSDDEEMGKSTDTEVKN